MLACTTISKIYLFILVHTNAGFQEAVRLGIWGVLQPDNLRSRLFQFHLFLPINQKPSEYIFLLVWLSHVLVLTSTFNLILIYQYRVFSLRGRIESKHCKIYIADTTIYIIITPKLQFKGHCITVIRWKGGDDSNL